MKPMRLDDVVKNARRLSEPFKVVKGKSFHLASVDPADRGPFKSGDKKRAREALALGVEALCELQERLYASDSWALLLIFQALDAAGKDSAIKHVMSGVNPQGCEVYSFKQPSSEELDHDYLWRCAKLLPRRGHIGIFNRSYYEEVLVVRVHSEYLLGQKLPPALRGRSIWGERHEDIARFERYLTRNGIVIRKFFLHVSKDEQKRRFLERLDRPDKRWKFSPQDVHERKHWSRYMAAYEDTIRATATPYAPWYVVPADHKWFTRVVVAAAIIDALGSLQLAYPTVRGEAREALKEARRALERD
jgi:PPK2 family polyphosphate:nucleotide phosphotransferase